MPRRVKSWLFGCTVLLLAALLLFSGWRVLLALKVYCREDAVKQEMLIFKPAEPVKHVGETPVFHDGIAKAKEINPDVIGWLTIPGTEVDYAFVYSKDNQDYLRRDLYGAYSLAGTIFLDHRNSPDCTDAVTILYGHNMKNGGMFGALERFQNPDFMQAHRQGEVVLENTRFAFTVFACAEVTPDDPDVFGLNAGRGELTDLVARLAGQSLCAEKTDWQESDSLLVLSTCAGAQGKDRFVVLACLKTG